MQTKFLIVFLLFSCKLFSQNLTSIQVNENSDLLYGKVYSASTYNAKGHPYFLSDKLFISTLTYNKKYYTDLNLKYDIYNQKLILFQDFQPHLPSFIELEQIFVDRFTFTIGAKSYQFINSKYIKDLPQRISYYELVYDSNIKYYIGRNKQLKKLGEDRKYDKFSQENSYYIEFNNSMNRILNKRQFFYLLSNKKKELKVFIRSNRLKFKLNNTETVTKILKHYEKLIIE